MALGILQHGIVQQHKNGTTTILRPDKNGRTFVEVAVPEELSTQFRLADGDIVEGPTEPLLFDLEEEAEDGEITFAEPEQWDQPSERPVAFNVPSFSPAFPTERLLAVTRINGLSLEEAEERPFARPRRSAAERSTPDRRVYMAVSPGDFTGRTLDFAAPLGLGVAGVIRGPHGSGLTCTLRTIATGLTGHAPDCVVLILLLRARSEEITHWRRYFPQADIVCASASQERPPEEVLRLADLVLEAAQRQTELGKDVVLLVDSLTGLWAAMLEVEEADAQAQADRSQARQWIREWIQKAGCFHGEGLLGSNLGGSLTILGTAWEQRVNEEDEEERELHPHLRLLEHLLPETSWQVVLSDTLAQARLYPAIDIKRCQSRDEERFLPPAEYDNLLSARAVLPRHDPLSCYKTFRDALEKRDYCQILAQDLSEP